MTAGAYAGDTTRRAEMAGAMVGVGAGIGTMIAAVVVMVIIVMAITAAVEGNPNVGATVIAWAVIVGTIVSRTIITGAACVISGRGATGQEEGKQGQRKKN